MIRPCTLKPRQICLPVGLSGSWNSIRIMYVKNKLLISFYAVRILSTKFEGYRHALYQQIIVYTVDLITRMHYAVFRIALNVDSSFDFGTNRKVTCGLDFENASPSLSTCIYKKKPFLRDLDVKVIQFLSTVSTVKNELFIKAKTTLFGNVTVGFTFLKSFLFNQNGFFASCKL